MPRWPTIQLGDLAAFRNGLNYTKTHLGQGLPVIGVKDFQDRTVVSFYNLDEIQSSALPGQDALVRAGDILFVRSNGNRNLIGRSMFLRSMPPRPTSHSGFTIRVRFTDARCDPRFFAYFFRGPYVRQVLSSIGGGTTISNLNQDILASLRVPLPPIAVQRHIASILSAYDDLIENNMRRIAILEEMARRLFEEGFLSLVDRLPLPGDTIRPPDLPLNIQLRSLGDVAILVMGQSPPSSTYNETQTGLPFHQGVTYFGSLFPVDRIYCTVLDTPRKAEPGDILLSVRAPVGRINVAVSRIILGRGLSAIRARNDSQIFLLSYLRALFAKPDIIGDGTIYKAVTKADLVSLPMLWPTSDLITEFQKHAGPMFAQMQTLDQSNRLLCAARDLLLPKLISGDIEMSTALHVIEAAAE